MNQATIERDENLLAKVGMPSTPAEASSENPNPITPGIIANFDAAVNEQNRQIELLKASAEEKDRAYTAQLEQLKSASTMSRNSGLALSSEERESVRAGAELLAVAKEFLNRGSNIDFSFDGLQPRGGGVEQLLQAASGDFGDAKTPALPTYLPRIITVSTRYTPWYNQIPKTVLPYIGGLNWKVYKGTHTPVAYTSVSPGKEGLDKDWDNVNAPEIHPNLNFDITQVIINTATNRYASEMMRNMTEMAFYALALNIEKTLLDAGSSGKLVGLDENNTSAELPSGTAGANAQNLTPLHLNAGLKAAQPRGMTPQNSYFLMSSAFWSKLLDAKSKDSAVSNLAMGITFNPGGDTQLTWHGYPIYVSDRMPATTNGKAAFYLISRNALRLEISLMSMQVAKSSSDQRNINIAFTPLIRGGVENKNMVLEFTAKT